jgi:hypothetical protein
MLRGVPLASLEEISLNASLRALDHQEGTLSELRSRTGVLLAASSLAISFLGPAAVDGGRPLAIAGASSPSRCRLSGRRGSSVPRSSFLFSVTGSNVFERLYSYRDDRAELHRRLAYDLADLWKANDRAMRRLVIVFQIAAAALGFEVAFLLVAAADTLL